MKLQALLGAGLLLGSMAADAALIVELPEFASFDLSAPRSSFTLDSTYSFDVPSPTQRIVDFSMWYSLERLTGPDPVGTRKDGRPQRDEASSDFQYFEGNIINAAFDSIIFGWFPQYNDRDISEGLQIGQIYRFNFNVSFGLGDFGGCEDPEQYRYGCESTFLSEGGSTIMSFFDSGTDIDVPVGPTAPLLAAGLVGLWMRKRKG